MATVGKCKGKASGCKAGGYRRKQPKTIEMNRIAFDVLSESAMMLADAAAGIMCDIKWDAQDATPAQVKKWKKAKADVRAILKKAYGLYL